jgi:dipeptidase E
MGKPQQIIAMGGGGFMMEPENPLLDQYILSATGASRPKICFVGTASGDTTICIDRFYKAFSALNSVPTHLSLFQPPTQDLHSFVMEQEAIYVGGGNTRNLLVLWKEWGLDSILREALATGVVLAGISAGSICWFEQGLSDSIRTGELHPLACLGFLPGSNCPHYDGEAERRPVYHRFIADGRLRDGYAADDGAALHFVDSKLAGAVSSRPQAKAYRVRWTPNGVEEAAIETEYQGAA